MEVSKLTRDGTAAPFSRDQILRRKRGQGKVFFPVQLTTSGIGNLILLINTFAICVTIHDPFTLAPLCDHVYYCTTGLATAAYITGYLVWLKPDRLSENTHTHTHALLRVVVKS